MSLNNKQQKTQAIIKAACHYFLQYGYNGATTDLIQKKAGVSKATLYNHFPTKESLFASVVNTRCKLFIEQVRAISLPDTHFSESLFRIGEAYLTLLLAPENQALFRAMVAEAPRFPGLAKTFYDAGPASILPVIAEAVNRALQKHELADNGCEPLRLATNFITVLRGKSQMYCLLHPDFIPDQNTIAEWVSEAVDIVLNQVSLP